MTVCKTPTYLPICLCSLVWAAHLLQTMISTMTRLLFLAVLKYVSHLLQTVGITMTDPLLSCGVWVTHLLQTVIIAMTGPLLSCGVWVAPLQTVIRLTDWPFAFWWCVSSTLGADCDQGYDWSFAFLWCASSTLVTDCVIGAMTSPLIASWQCTSSIKISELLLLMWMCCQCH